MGHGLYCGVPNRETLHNCINIHYSLLSAQETSDLFLFTGACLSAGFVGLFCAPAVGVIMSQSDNSTDCCTLVSPYEDFV